MQPALSVAQTQLLDTGLLEAAVSAIVGMLKAEPAPSSMSSPTTPTSPSSSPSPSTTPSIPRSLAQYVVGEPPASTAHYEVTTALRRTLTGCRQLIVLSDDLLNARVPAGCVLGDADCDLAWHALIVATRGVITTPSLRDSLGSVDASSITEDEFVQIIKAFTSYFQANTLNFSEMNQYLQTSVLPRLHDQELRTALENLLSTLEDVLAPELGIQAALANTLRCFENNDEDASVYHMLYMLLGNASFATSEVVAMTPAPDNETIAWIGRLAHHLRVQQSDFDAIIRVVSTLLSQENVAIILPSLLRTADAGLFSEPSLFTPKPCP